MDMLNITIDRALANGRHVGWRIRGPRAGLFLGTTLPSGAAINYVPYATATLEMETIDLEPPSIAADLKTPPAGAVEGAEILPWRPAVGGECQVRKVRKVVCEWADAERLPDAGGLLHFRMRDGERLLIHPDRVDENVRRLEPAKASPDTQGYAPSLGRADEQRVQKDYLQGYRKGFRDGLREGLAMLDQGIAP